MSYTAPYTAGEEIRFMRGLYETRQHVALGHIISLTLWRARRFDPSVDRLAVEREALTLWERMQPEKG